MSKIKKYYLNGKEVDKATIKKRKATLSHVDTIVEEHYECGLDEKEKEEARRSAEAAMEYFQEQRDIREDQEKFH
jgi:hypothetical protein